VSAFPFVMALAIGAWVTYIIIDSDYVPDGKFGRVQQVCACIVLGWLTALLLEGLGLIGEYTGPMPHM